MLAAVYHGPEDIRLEQVPIPGIGPAEALLRVSSTGICGTDLRIFHGAHRKYPPGTRRIPGHEVVGQIAAVGRDVRGLEAGQPAFLAPNMGCGHCRQCVSGNNNLCADYAAPGITFDGSFAEYMRIPAAALQQGNLMPLPEGIDPAAAAMIEPFACVLRGQAALHIQPGESVLIVGAGPIGLMHLLLARLRGAGQVIVSELAPDRLEQAKSFGADLTVNPAETDLQAAVLEATHGLGADAAIVAAPAHRAQEMIIDLLAIQGRVNFFGGLPKERPLIQLNANQVHYKELQVTGTTACSTDDCRKALEIVQSGKLDLSRVVGRRFPLERVREALEAAENGRTLKVVMEP
jgi:L-iditol 2-dehydrogenase